MITEKESESIDGPLDNLLDNSSSEPRSKSSESVEKDSGSEIEQF
jgi:hypothetical protein